MNSLKPIGVFWDIENCCVPKGKSALKIIERIRERFFQDFREAEFICVCDINKEPDATIKELNDGQINVVHINAVAKNAADDKIRQSLRRFSDSHPPGTRVILISSDVNFASDLSDLRHRKKFDVVIIHNAYVSEALLSCATEHHLYEDLIKDLPDRPSFRDTRENFLVIQGYSKDGPFEKISRILKMLSNNCGGKVLSIGPLFAILKFDTPELLDRAKKRMDGADVYGRKITVCLPEETPFFNTIKKLTAAHYSKRQESPSPQRRPGRERNSSRGFTPDPHGRVSGGFTMSDYGLYEDGFGSYDLCKNNFSDNPFSSSAAAAAVLNDSKSYKMSFRQPTGHVGSPSVDGQGNSPSHTHTLPNSNSEKYYSTKSGPPSLENSPNLVNGGNRSSGGASSQGNMYNASRLDPFSIGGTFGTNNFSSAASGTSSLGDLNNVTGTYVMGDLNNVTGTYVMGDLSNAATSSGEPITVFKLADKRRLADIPIPSFGFRDIPPPPMPSAYIESQNSDPSAAAFDPIKLIEAASQDSRNFLMTKSNLLGPEFLPEHPDSQPPLHSLMHQTSVGDTLYTPSSNTLASSIFTSSKSSAFTEQPSVPSTMCNNYHTQHQSRSLSVPLQHDGSSMESVVSEDEICVMRGYSPSSGFRSHSQNSGVFKRPNPVPNICKNTQNSAGFQNHQHPGSKSAKSRSHSRDPSKSLSSDGEDRPYSPVNSHSAGRQSFRPRLSSAPSSGVAPARTNRTPSPLAGQSVVRPRVVQHGSNLYRVPTPAEIGDPSNDYVHPDFNSGGDPYVELIVSNLDYNIQPKEWRKIIYATFQPHVKILSIQVRLQADHTSVATVRLPSEQDARFAIAQFHRRKIGYKRINVHFKTDGSQSPADSLRADTIALLMEAKDYKMPLSRLIDLFDRRFHKTVSVSDVYKMRDTVHIVEMGGAGRWVKLLSDIRRSPMLLQNPEDETSDIQEQAVCPIHCPEGSVYYTESLTCSMLPNVMILRKHFSPQLHSLLLSHNGYIPLMSFPACFAAEFKAIESVKEGGIPLEHVISCVPGVEITLSKAGVKVIQFQENRDPFYDMMKGNSWQELGKISREVMELLRQQLTCIMPVSKFIPAYHHYFGRQCRVADYGYTKLQELFEAIPHAIQVLGTGDRKAITLSPRAQLKRFTTDIIKVVKAQPTKQVMLSDFPKAYEIVMGKPLFLPHYGVCFMEDVLMDIPVANLIVIQVIDEGNTLLALPRKDQTPEEVEKTKQFALEVVDLLKHNPECRMPFNKFIPAYHHHFGRQCRVADYGFQKLTDLFEAIAHVAEIEEDGEERMIHLAPAELRKVLCEQLTSLIRPAGTVAVSKILLEYAKHFGFCLKLEDFKVDSVKALLLKLKNHIKIELRDNQEYASLVKEVNIPQLGLHVMQLLMDESGGSLPIMELCMRYESKFSCSCDLSQIKEELCDFVQVDESDSDTGGIIRLTSQQMLGRNLRLLVLHHGHIFMSELCNLYHDQYGVELSPALYGFSSLYQLLLSFPHILELKGRPQQKYIKSAGMLSVPDTLPPSRVDVTSPVQFSQQSPHFKQETVGSSISSDKGHHSGPAETARNSISDLLHHASQLWDPNIAMQPLTGTTSNGLTDATASQVLLSGTVDQINGQIGCLALDDIEKREAKRALALSPHGVPIAWQMKAGGDQVVSGNIGASINQVSPISSTSRSPSTTKKKSPRGKGKNKHQAQLRNQAAHKSRDQLFSHELSSSSSADIDERSEQAACNTRQDLEDDIFSLVDPPLDTSSVRSQHSSSSQSSIASPVKRKTRIAANFAVGQ
ncbi:hypothetical protein BsWGS_20919 [Bradybaena similaris]